MIIKIMLKIKLTNAKWEIWLIYNISKIIQTGADIIQMMLLFLSKPINLIDLIPNDILIKHLIDD
jgi:hypothetical protein